LVNIDRAIKITEKVIKLGTSIDPCPERLRVSIEALVTTEEAAEVAASEGRYALKYKKNAETKTPLTSDGAAELADRLNLLVGDLNADCRVVRAHIPKSA
jgi:hypothetical protein